MLTLEVQTRQIHQSRAKRQGLNDQVNQSAAALRYQEQQTTEQIRQAEAVALRFRKCIEGEPFTKMIILGAVLIASNWDLE